MEHILLVTNDDGIHSPGLQALAEALASLGQVFVVAPDREMSACGQSLTLKSPLRAESRGPRRFAVDGTPADCVNLAVAKLLAERPHIVVSGINRGANLGDDVFYSGTVGGAREGTFFGIPSIAMSLAGSPQMDFAPAAAIAVRLAAMVLERGLPEDTLLNVNVPAGAPRSLVLTVQGRRRHQGTVLEGIDPRRRPYFWIEEVRDQWVADDRSDAHAFEQGLVSVTPLQTDTTAHSSFAKLREFESLLDDRPAR